MRRKDSFDYRAKKMAERNRERPKIISNSLFLLLSPNKNKIILGDSVEVRNADLKRKPQHSYNKNSERRYLKREGSNPRSNSRYNNRRDVSGSRYRRHRGRSSFSSEDENALRKSVK